MRSTGVIPGRDLAAYLTEYPKEITFGDDEPDQVFDRYHTPDFVICSDGVPLDRDKLLAHVRPARRRVARIHTEVHQAHVSGDQVAAHYSLTAVMNKGAEITTEIYMFGQLAPDGRLRRCDQQTRPIPASRD